MPPFKTSIVSLISLFVLITSAIAATMSAQLEANLQNPPLGRTGMPLRRGAMLRQDVDEGLAQRLVAQANQNGEVEAPVFDNNGEQTGATVQYQVKIQQVAGNDWFFLQTADTFNNMDECNQAMRSINFFINKGGNAISQSEGSVITKGSGTGEGSGKGSGGEDPDEGGDSTDGVGALRRSAGIQRGQYVKKSM